MDFGLLFDNLLSPAILFFVLGVLAALFRSDLEIPQPLPKFFSLYLLLAIGFKGGVGLRQSGLTPEILSHLGLAVGMAILVPLYSFLILRWKLDTANAVGIAATYGSVSAVTFVTASSFLNRLDVPFGGHMVAAMALMESPAIIVGVMLYRKLSPAHEGEPAESWGALVRDAFANGSVFLLMGSLVIGAITGEAGKQVLAPFTQQIFTGILCFFLLDMGIIAARRLDAIRQAGAFLVGFALLVPLLNGLLGIGLGRLVGMAPGEAFMLTVLCASASYIAVPAALRLAVPQANPSLYVPMALGLTFPFNIVAGLPLYWYLIQKLWG